MEHTQKEVAKLFADAYSSGDFSALYETFSENYEHMSFWVLDVLRGKNNAIEYYIGKGNSIRNSNSQIKCFIVEIVNAPDKVRPGGIFVNGEQIEEDSAFLNREDTGKYAVLMEQEINNELSRTLAIPSVDEFGKCKQLLITDPENYDLIMIFTPDDDFEEQWDNVKYEFSSADYYDIMDAIHERSDVNTYGFEQIKIDENDSSELYATGYRVYIPELNMSVREGAECSKEDYEESEDTVIIYDGDEKDPAKYRESYCNILLKSVISMIAKQKGINTPVTCYIDSREFRLWD